MKNMLVVDSAYCYEDLKSRQLENFVLARDPGNHFSNVITIHPFAGVQFSSELGTNALYGHPATHKLDLRNVFIEGKRGRFVWLKRFEKFNYALSLFSVLRIVFSYHKKYKFRVIRAEDALINGVIGWIISSLTRTPLVIGIWANFDAIRRDTQSPTMPRIFKSIQFEQRWEKFILSRAQVILVGNLDNKKFVMNKGIDPSKIEVLPVLFNLNEHHLSEPTHRLPIDSELHLLGIEDKDLIICISRLEPVKLVDHVLRAIPHIRPHEKDFRVLILGEGSQLDELVSLCRELSITEKVNICGNRNQEWIARLLAHGDIVVSPLTGRALAESAMGGAAIVAYDMEWQGELIKTNITGELVPRHDFVAMADSISRYLNDPLYKKRMGTAVREEIIKKMSAVDIAAKTNSIYTKVSG